MKQALLDQVIALLEGDLETLKAAAAETHKASTGDESKQEGKYDTRGLEASYLAEAQAEQVRSLEKGLHKLKTLVLKEEEDRVSLGSIAIISGDEQDYQFYLLPAGGGTILEYEDEPLTVITPESPIGKILLGRSIADSIETEQFGEVFVSEIY